MLDRCCLRRADRFRLPRNGQRTRAGWVASRRPKGKDRTTISCSKSEIKLRLPHAQSCLSARPGPMVPTRPAATGGKTAKKNFSPLMPRNPLISLDSDRESKEIQGNPTLISGGFRNQTATGQANRNGSIGPTLRGRRRGGGQSTSIQIQSALGFHATKGVKQNGEPSRPSNHVHKGRLIKLY